MLADPVHQALDRVRELQDVIVERRRFRGYSGKARAIAGLLALAAAILLSRPGFPGDVRAHVFGWGVVFTLAAGLNFFAVFHWFFTDSETRGDWRRMKPLLDFLPSLFVGAAFTAALLARGFHDLLFGAWMCLFGLGNLASHAVLPRAIWPLGLFYLVCGACCLTMPWIRFADPWPMGLVFCVGELWGGWIFHRNRIATIAATRLRRSVA